MQFYSSVWGYWKEIVIRAFWATLALFDQNPRLLLVGLAGMAVTGILVRVFRGKEAFVEHLKSNVALVIGGGVVTFLLFFPYFLLTEPATQIAEARILLARSEDAKNSLEMAKYSAQLLRQYEDHGLVPITHSGGRTPAVPATPPDIAKICANLDDCPTPELKKRVLGVASDVEDMYREYMKVVQEPTDEEHKGVHEAVIRAKRYEYSKKYIDNYEDLVLQYRHAVLKRLPPGSRDHENDYLYDLRGADWYVNSWIEHAHSIAEDLKQLVSRLPS